MKIFCVWLLIGLAWSFPLVCLSSGIYKVEDEKGHITYTNTPSAIDKRKDVKKLTGAAPINIITPRGSVTTRHGTLATSSRHENNSSAGLQKHDLDNHQVITKQQPAARLRRLGDSLRALDVPAVSAHRGTREKLVHDQSGIDSYNIQVFDLKIKSY